MQLSPQQLKAFDDQGYVFLPNCFADEEVALMRSEGEDILTADRQEVWREKTGAPRTAFAAATFFEKTNPPPVKRVLLIVFATAA